MRASLWLLGAVVLACRPPSSVAELTPMNFEMLPPVQPLGTEAALPSRWPGALQSQYDGAAEETLVGVDSIKLKYRVFGRGRPNVVVLVAGRTEPMVKYAEVVDDLVANGFAVYALDVRGQGASERMLPNTQKGYVANFRDYVRDLDTFITQVVKADAPSHVFLLAHSMGGAIVTWYADEHPDALTGVAMTAPMLEINTGSFPPPVAASLTVSACSASDGSAYAIGAGDYVEETKVDDSSVTSSANRWQFKVNVLRERPEQRIGGYTWRWLCEAFKGSSDASKLGPFAQVPTLLIQAGADTVVKPASQTRYCTDSKVCQLVTLSQSKHEVLQEVDAVRTVALTDIIKFFKALEAR